MDPIIRQTVAQLLVCALFLLGFLAWESHLDDKEQKRRRDLWRDK